MKKCPSKAKVTIMGSILLGLCEHANITGVTAEHANMISDDILARIFDDCIIRSIKEYLKELEE